MSASFVCPRYKVGTLLGRAGATIRQLQEAHGVTRIDLGDSRGAGESTTVTVHGGNAEACVTDMRMLLDNGFCVTTHPSHTLEKFIIPNVFWSQLQNRNGLYKLQQHLGVTSITGKAVPNSLHFTQLGVAGGDAQTLKDFRAGLERAARSIGLFYPNLLETPVDDADTESHSEIKVQPPPPPINPFLAIPKVAALPPATPPPPATPCHLCGDDFSFFRRAVRCAACSKVVCDGCSDFVEALIAAPGSDEADQGGEERFCHGDCLKAQTAKLRALIENENVALVPLAVGEGSRQGLHGVWGTAEDLARAQRKIALETDEDTDEDSHEASDDNAEDRGDEHDGKHDDHDDRDDHDDGRADHDHDHEDDSDSGSGFAERYLKLVTDYKPDKGPGWLDEIRRIKADNHRHVLDQQRRALRREKVRQRKRQRELVHQAAITRALAQEAYRRENEEEADVAVETRIEEVIHGLAVARAENPPSLVLALEKPPANWVLAIVSALAGVGVLVHPLSADAADYRLETEREKAKKEGEEEVKGETEKSKKRRLPLQVWCARGQESWARRQLYIAYTHHTSVLSSPFVGILRVHIPHASKGQAIGKGGAAITEIKQAADEAAGLARTSVVFEEKVDGKKGRADQLVVGVCGEKERAHLAVKALVKVVGRVKRLGEWVWLGDDRRMLPYYYSEDEDDEEQDEDDDEGDDDDEDEYECAVVAVEDPKEREMRDPRDGRGMRPPERRGSGRMSPVRGRGRGRMRTMGPGRGGLQAVRMRTTAEFRGRRGGGMGV